MVRKPLWLSRLWIIPVAMVINSVSLASPFLSVKFVAALRGRPHQKNQTKTGSIIVGNYPDKSWSSNQKKKTYCGWKKSCTTLDGWNPINDGINHLSTGAGFRNHPPYHILSLFIRITQTLADFCCWGSQTTHERFGGMFIHPTMTCCRIVPLLVHFAHSN